MIQCAQERSGKELGARRAMALRSKAMQGLARRVMAPQSMLPVRSGGGGPVALGRPPNRPVRLLFPGKLVHACLDMECSIVVPYWRGLQV